MTWIHQGVQWLGGVIVRGAVKVKRDTSDQVFLQLELFSGRWWPDATVEEELQPDRSGGAAV